MNNKWTDVLILESFRKASVLFRVCVFVYKRDKKTFDLRTAFRCSGVFIDVSWNIPLEKRTLCIRQSHSN